MTRTMAVAFAKALRRDAGGGEPCRRWYGDRSPAVGTRRSRVPRLRRCSRCRTACPRRPLAPRLRVLPGRARGYAQAVACLFRRDTSACSREGAWPTLATSAWQLSAWAPRLRARISGATVSDAAMNAQSLSARRACSRKRTARSPAFPHSGPCRPRPSPSNGRARSCIRFRRRPAHRHLSALCRRRRTPPPP
jgi:hypothetical protein